MSRARPLAAILAAIFLGATLLALVLGPAMASTTAGPLEVIASGLNGPRHLEFGPDGALYVAEAGYGGEGPPCVLFDPADPTSMHCYGPSGSITRIADGAQERVVTGLPSHAAPSAAGPFAGFEATGPQAMTWDTEGQMYVVIGLGGSPTQTMPGGGWEGIEFGWVVSATAGNEGGSWDPLFDVAATEYISNPDGHVLDSNPYDLIATADGFTVVDAGGNDLLGYSSTGELQDVFSVFPFTPTTCTIEVEPGVFVTVTIPIEPVPTAVEIGPDDAYYVGELTGFCFEPGLADIYRVEEGVPGYSIEHSNFTNVTDIAFDSAGNLYVLEMAENGLMALFPQMVEYLLFGTPITEYGRIIRITPDGTRTVVARNGLVAPTGLTVGPDGYLYVSNWGVGAELGQIVRIAPYQVLLPVVIRPAE